MTVWRNGALVLWALLAVVAGLQGVGLIGAVVDGDALPWIAMAALTAAVAVLVAYRAPTAASAASEVGPRLDADGNYEREPTPQRRGAHRGRSPGAAVGARPPARRTCSCS